MFWAKTSPVPEAATDFGEIAPPKVVLSERRPRSQRRAARGVAGDVRAAAASVATGRSRPCSCAGPEQPAAAQAAAMRATASPAGPDT